MRVLYVDPRGHLGTLEEPRLDATSERHLVALPPPPVAPGEPIAVLRRDAALGMVVELDRGCPSHRQIRLLKRAVALGRRVWVYWPEEGLVECVTRERLGSYRRHWLMINVYRLVAEPVTRGAAVPRRLSYALRDMPPREMPGWMVRRVARVMSRPRTATGTASDDGHPSQPGSDTPALPPMVRHAQRLGALREARQTAKAVRFPPLARLPDQLQPIRGCGVYLRTDFWSPIVSGGSYGHTCYVAKELAAVTESFVCFMANPFAMLDEFGLRQIVMPRPSATNNEDDIAAATPYYLSLLRPAFEQLRPAYIYERLCLGNSAGALLSAELGVPYFLEYNGSEISMRRSFEGTGYVYEAEYLEAEALAFEQATLVSVVSAEIRNGLVARGVDPSKIVVNPNGVDLEAYAPAPPAQRDAIRRELGFDPSDCVVGFTGTFGGWHGIDVLSEALPRICQGAPRAKFLLIGDGNFKHLVDRAVQSSGLQRQVVSMGRVAQVEGARLLKACDVYVSPHSTHMIDSKFFGSPTKIFEYMALGGGIVASDLEQIGQVLSPALTADEAAAGAAVARQRAVLCTPGDVDQFVRGVVALARQPDLARALGRNAHEAARDHYSWTRHVANLWLFLTGDATASDIAPDLRRKRTSAEGPTEDAMALTAAGRPSGRLIPPQHIVATGDAYKDQVQRQWNNDPAGSHYVSEATDHTKEWFLEAERYRYGSYAPWMPETMEFDRYRGKALLEIGGGMGTDLAQFAVHGARVTDVDLSSGHLKLAKENFAVRGLHGRFVQQDAESLVFDDNAFDVVYSNGVLHHTPNTRHVVQEILESAEAGRAGHRDGLRRGFAALLAQYGVEHRAQGRAAVGVLDGRDHVPHRSRRSDNAAAHPLVKVVYQGADFASCSTASWTSRSCNGRCDAGAMPRVLALVPRRHLGKIMGWNLSSRPASPTVDARSSDTILAPADRLTRRFPPRLQPLLHRRRLTADVAATGLVDDCRCRRRRDAGALHAGMPADALAALQQRDAERTRATIRAAERVLRARVRSPRQRTVRADRSGSRGLMTAMRRSTGISIRCASCAFPRGCRTRSGICWKCALRTPMSNIRGSWRDASIGRRSARHSSSRTTIASPLRSPASSTTSSRRIRSASASTGRAPWTSRFVPSVGPSVSSRCAPAPPLDDAFWGRAYTALFDHGVFIRNNLENTYEVTSNHFLSNLLGL